MKLPTLILFLFGFLLTPQPSYATNKFTEDRQQVDCDDGTFCLHNGICVRDSGSNPATYSCQCRSGYRGPVCGVEEDYVETPILNSDGSTFHSSTAPKESKLTKQQVVGILVGVGIAVALIVLVAIWCCCCRGKRAAKKAAPSKDTATTSDPTISVENNSDDDKDSHELKEESLKAEDSEII